MKKLLFLLLIAVTFSGCYYERAIYTHRHPWNGMYHVHRYYQPRFSPPPMKRW